MVCVLLVACTAQCQIRVSPASGMLTMRKMNANVTADGREICEKYTSASVLLTVQSVFHQMNVSLVPAMGTRITLVYVNVYPT